MNPIRTDLLSSVDETLGKCPRYARPLEVIPIFLNHQ